MNLILLKMSISLFIIRVTFASCFSSKCIAAGKIPNAIKVRKNYCCKAHLLNCYKIEAYDKSIDSIANLFKHCGA